MFFFIIGIVIVTLFKTDVDIRSTEVYKVSEKTHEPQIMCDFIPIERKDSYNNELQYYTKDNVNLDDKSIEIVSKNEIKEDKLYTSGLVESTNSYKYGFFQFEIELSEGAGIFPAIWMMPENGEAYPELDIFEMIGSEPTTFYGVNHYLNDNEKKRSFYSENVEKKDRYTVAVNWSEKSITWYIDHKKVYETHEGVPNDYMYIIINQAIGGNWPGSPNEKTEFPSTFKILNYSIDAKYERRRI